MIELLKGIRILDLSRLLPGPLCSMFLADMGAEVIKIEDTQTGDYTRWDEPKVKENSAFFLLINRNKKSVRLNLKEPDGLAIFQRMAESADVIIEQFRPGVATKLKVDYESMKKINPAIVYCSLTGFGQDGPYRDKAGHDINYIGYSGLLGQTGRRKGQPIIPGMQVADEAGGSMMAVMGILAAIVGKVRTGTGEYIDVSMMDGALSLMVIAMGTYFGNGLTPARGDSLLTGGTPCYDVYETKDGKFMALGALEPKFWDNFCNAVGRPELVKDQFAQDEKREKVREAVAKVFKEKNRREWSDFFSDKDVCCTPILELDEALQNEQTLARSMVYEVEHPHEGRIRQLGFPVKFGNSVFETRLPAPMWGEHTEEILKEIGYTPRELESLRDKGII